MVAAGASTSEAALVPGMVLDVLLGDVIADREAGPLGNTIPSVEPLRIHRQPTLGQQRLRLFPERVLLDGCKCFVPGGVGSGECLMKEEALAMPSLTRNAPRVVPNPGPVRVRTLWWISWASASGSHTASVSENVV